MTRLRPIIPRWPLVAAIAVAAAPVSGQKGAPKVDPIPWSSSRPLTWADYRGAADLSTDAMAMTVYLLGYETECNGDHFSAAVTTTFQPDRSWVRTTILETAARATRLLEHEQLHFDLSELHARRLRQCLAGLKDACAMEKKDLDALVTKRVRDITSTQLQYDRETDFGRDTRAQAKWSADTAQALAKSAAWSAR